MQQRPQYLMTAFAAAGHESYFVDPRPVDAFHDAGVDVVPRLADVPRRHVILYVHFAPLLELVPRFDDSVVIYDVYDDLAIFAADETDVPAGRRVAAHHDAMMRRADLVVASSPVIAEGLAHDGPLLVVPNGVDVDLFTPHRARPDDLPATGPLVGYHGMVSHWFDFDLFAAVADLRPEWSFVIVGPVDARVADRMATVADRPNVTVLGQRSAAEVAGYVASFDVAVIWFRVDDLTRAVSPLKMYEAMACGVPVVAPPLPACLAEPLVRVADGAAEFAAAIGSALQGGAESAALRSAAAAASWSARLAPVLDWLGDYDLREVSL